MSYLSKENVQELLALSALQESIWAADQRTAGGQALHTSWRLTGRLDAEVAARAWEHVVRQSPMLRMIYRQAKGQTAQIQLKERPVPVGLIDSEELPAADQEEVRANQRREQLQPFVLSDGPLLRLALLRRSATEGELLLTGHAICLDRMSCAHLIDDWLQTYAAMAEGRPLPSLARPHFKEYMAWVARQDWKPAREFFQAQLGGFEAPTRITPAVGAPLQEAGVDACARELSDLMDEVNHLAARHKTTVRVIMQAAWSVLLGVYSGEREVTFGCEVPGRPPALPGAQAMIGPLGQRLPLRVDVLGACRLSDYLQMLAAQDAALNQFAFVPPERIRALAGLGEHEPLFGTTLAVREEHVGAGQPLRATAQADELPPDQDLWVTVITGDALRILLTYRTELLDAERAKRLLGHFEMVLRSMLAQPDPTLAELNLLTDQEREQVLVAFNRADVGGPLDRLVHTVIEERVAKHPERIAAVFGAESISYGELNARANRLAHWLRAQGFGRDDLAALFAERTIAMQVAILAVAKAGGAYVPLDPAHPNSRLQTILETSQAKMMLTQEALAQRSLELAAALATAPALFCLDRAPQGLGIADPGVLVGLSTENPTLINEPCDLANVFFTSGSTGQPKGAMVEHLGMLNHMWAKILLMGMDERSVLVQNASHCFDISVWQFLAPLMVGGRVVIYDNEVAGDPHALLAAVRRDGATVLELVPTMIEMFLQAAAEAGPTESQLPALTYMISTGEALPVALCRKWLLTYPHAKVVNAYGATECSDDTTHEVIATPPPADQSFMSVGTPIPNFCIYIIDRWGRPVPLGCQGEICFTGVGVGRGYLNAPDKTEAVFVPNPFGDRFGSKMYRNGDRGCHLPDGRIVFLGRLDYQVKVRGHRIELGEIEATLLRHRAMQQAVAIVRPDAAGQNRILAYVVMADDTTTAELRDFLHVYLPEYMVPEHIIRLEAMPVNRNGKVERKLLPDPDEAQPQQEMVAPATPTEARLAALWAEVMGLQAVSVEENFFALGGHSLKLIQVRSRIQSELGVNIPLRTLFEKQSIREQAALIDARSGEGQVGGALMRLPDAAHYPLSHAQRRLWFLQQAAPHSAAYNMPAAFELTGQIKPAALQQALQALVNRHEALRTSFTTVEGEPMQRIWPNWALPCPIDDLTDRDEAAQEEAVRALLELEFGRAFDLETEPPMRCRIIRRAPNRYLVGLVIHHIIGDAWSWDILGREFTALYEAISQGRGDPLPPLALRYVDYAAWQNGQLAAGALAPDEQFWLDQMQGELPRLNLPLDHPRPPVQRFFGRTIERTLAPGLRERLDGLGAQQQATLFMVLLAGTASFLSRLTGQDDIIVGTPSAGRSQVELEPLVGFFVGTLPLRVQVSRGVTFRRLVDQVRRLALDAYAHEAYPFDQLVARLNPVRDPSRSPLFDLSFQVIRASEQAERPGLVFHPYEMALETAKFDLTITFIEKADGLACASEYNLDLFEAATIDRWMKHLERLLEAAVAQPDRPVALLPLLTAAEQQQILQGFNRTAGAPSIDRCAHTLFEEQVERTPEAIALRCGDLRLTFRELNSRANALAHRLRQLGVGPDTLVAICAERSPVLVVGLLAVLKAGGAYVPLDPTYPRERLAFMLADAAPRVLLTHERLLAQLPPYGGPTICLDLAPAADGAATNPLGGATPESLAYVIYTSGSTGQPKGAMIHHRGLVNYLVWASAAYLTAGGAGAPVHSSVSFDLTITSLFVPLIAGQPTLLLEEAPGAQALGAALLAQGDFSLVKITPAHLRLLAAEVGPERAAGCTRAFVIGGEQLNAADIAFWRAHAPDTMLINEYGPTEAVVGCCVYTVPADAAIGPAIPIGRPIANTRLYLLDAQGQPVPIGVAGELYIGGAGVCRGYLNRPALTAERFVPDPFGPQAGARLYRTGDLARYLEDGTLQYLGRVDDQVKMRGYRIELGEIEAALRQQPGVRTAAAHLRQEEEAESRLVGYVVADSDQRLDREALRQALRRTLPDYMVPAVVMQIDHLPLSPNGKLDRKALPAPEAEAGSAQWPATPIAAMVAEVWAQVLGQNRLGAHDHFFERGGHSLLAIRAISQLNQLFAINLPLHAIFEAPTVAALAARITAVLSAGGMVEQAPLVAVGRDRELPLSYAQQRLWMLDQMEPGRSWYNVPVALRLQGEIDIEALQQSLYEVICRHESLRTLFRQQEGRPFQAVTDPYAPPFIVEDLRTLPASEREERALERAAEAAERPFDLSQGPLLRALLLRLSDKEQIFLLTIHHILSDAWSIEVLINELATRYRAMRAGEHAALPPLMIQYPDYAVWQRQALTTELLTQQLAYWTQQLAGSSLVCELPTDRPRPAVQSYRGSSVTVALPNEIYKQVQVCCRSAGVTPFMLLLAAFKALLYRYTAQTDIHIGTVISNRDRVALEPLIGFFMNTLVLRTDLSGDPTFGELLERTRRVTVGAYAHQHLPFEQLIEALQPPRDTSRNPVVQVMFTYQATTSEMAQFDGLTVSPLVQRSNSTKFDLTLGLSGGADGLVAEAEYSTDLFDHTTIERMLASYQRLLAGALADPTLRLSELPLLAAAEQDQLLYAWNQTARPYPRDEGLAARFAEQVERFGDRPAVVCEAERLTYGELNQAANRLAHRLQAMGVGPDLPVALCLDRSTLLVIALLAIIKAGGAYVPLDPTYPQERLAFMLADSGAPVLLTEQRYAGAFDTGAHQTLLLDSEALMHGDGAANPPCAATGAHLAYIMYTSGSTGAPKGTLVTQRAVSRLVCNTDYIALGPSSVVAQASNTAFDAATFEIWGALLNGGALVIVPRTTLLAPKEFARFLVECQIDTLFLTTALFHQIAALIPSAFQSLRYLLFGGEACDPKQVQAVLRAGPPQTLLHVYGPTETTTFATCYAVTAVADDAATVPIGCPIANTECYLLDRAGRPVPVGVVGELYIGGDGIARGYLNRPELTAERFVPHPFVPGARLYRTGDLARWRPDGKIEFLGRLDNQVKLRGFRIELAEIEAALARHPQVGSVATVLRADRPGDKRLVAYYTAPAPLAPGDLREFLRERLPDYMIPALFIQLQGAMPLTPNGKVNRQALPEPESDLDLNVVINLHGTPRDQLELQMVKLWEEVLQVSFVGIHDNFFQLGGHSMKAIELASAIKTRFGADLPLTLLFQAGTVAALCDHLRQGQTGAPGCLILLQQGDGSRPPIFLVHPGGGGVLCYYHLARMLGAEERVYGLQALGYETDEEPLTSFEAMADRYLAEMRTVAPHGPYRIAGWSCGGIITVEIVRRLEALGEEIAFVGLLDVPAFEEARYRAVAGELGHAPTPRTFGVALFGMKPEQFDGLDADQAMALFLQGAQEKRYFPQGATVEVARCRLRVDMSIRIAMNTFRAPGKIRSNLVLFKATDVSTFMPVPPVEPDEWAEVTEGQVQVVHVPGDHHTIIYPPQVSALAAAMRHSLGAAARAPQYAGGEQ